MPTVEEINNPELSYCKDMNAHCLCPKCKVEYCAHTCDECKSANRIKDTLEKRKSPLLKKENVKKFLASVTKPVTRCSLKKIMEEDNGRRIEMKIQTISIVCGTTACNAKCPFCISKMTPQVSCSKARYINKHNLKKACRLAEKGGATTCLITGKGEPTLYPGMLTEYLEEINDYFPLIELQTNGMKLKELYEEKILDKTTEGNKNENDII